MKAADIDMTISLFFISPPFAIWVFLLIHFSASPQRQLVPALAMAPTSPCPRSSVPQMNSSCSALQFLISGRELGPLNTGVSCALLVQPWPGDVMARGHVAILMWPMRFSEKKVWTENYCHLYYKNHREQKVIREAEWFPEPQLQW